MTLFSKMDISSVRAVRASTFFSNRIKVLYVSAFSLLATANASWTLVCTLSNITSPTLTTVLLVSVTAFSTPPVTFVTTGSVTSVTITAALDEPSFRSFAARKRSITASVTRDAMDSTTDSFMSCTVTAAFDKAALKYPFASSNTWFNAAALDTDSAKCSFTPSNTWFARTETRGFSNDGSVTPSSFKGIPILVTNFSISACKRVITKSDSSVNAVSWKWSTVANDTGADCSSSLSLILASFSLN